jgi:copper chaperone CopZ
MTHTYTVTGMTCNGCKASVEDKLNSIDDVTKVSVDLEKAEAKIEMKQHIAMNTLQQVLSNKYIISEKKE